MKNTTKIVATSPAKVMHFCNDPQHSLGGKNDANVIHLHNTVASPFFGNFSCNHALEIATVVVKKAFNDNNLCKNMLSKLTVCVGMQPMS